MTVSRSCQVHERRNYFVEPYLLVDLHKLIMALLGGAADLKLFLENPGLTRSSRPVLRLLSAETMLYPCLVATTRRNSLMVSHLVVTA